MSAVLTAAVPATPWRRALPALGLVLLAILLLYRDTFVLMAGIWTRSETFAHAWLVPPIVLWLAWRKRATLATFTPVPQPWLILPMIGVAAVWLLGDLAGINALTQLCVTAMLVLSVPAVLGLPVARQLTFPLGFLFFMVPVGDFLLPVMMEATADFTVAAVAFSGVPVYREGLQFIIPTGAWSVVEACSGVRYLIASFMVGTLFAYLNYRTLWRRWVFVGVAILVPVLANWLRAYMIVMLGHLSGNKLAVGVDHLIYGWVFFGVVIGLLFFIGSRWTEAETPVPPEAEAAPPASGRPAAWAVGVLAVLAIAWPQAAAWQLAHSDPSPVVSLSLPSLMGTKEASGQAPLLSPVFAGASAQASRVYDLGTATVTVHVAYYKRQTYGAKLVSSDNALFRYEDHAWNRVTAARTDLDVAGRTLQLRTAELISGGTGSSLGRKRLDVRQTYWSGGQFTSSDHWATILGVLGRLRGQGDDGAVITIYTEGEAGVTGPRLNAFIGSHLQALETQLARVRDAR